MIQAVRGTYDLLPGAVEIWRAVESRLRNVFHAYGFSEVRPPVREHPAAITPNYAPEYFIAPLGDAAFEYATLLARKLRAAGVRVYLDFDGRSLKSQMRLADKLKAKSVLIIGEEEMKSGALLLRDMATKEQHNIREEALFETRLPQE